MGWVCDVCLLVIKCYGLRIDVQRSDSCSISEEMIVTILDHIGLMPMCPQCFKELSGAEPQSTDR